jgi:hypothetical protein
MVKWSTARDKLLDFLLAVFFTSVDMCLCVLCVRARACASVCIYMYVCTYVCMYVFMYVYLCMYACLFVRGPFEKFVEHLITLSRNFVEVQ